MNSSFELNNDNDYSIYNLNSFVHFIQNNIYQILLFILVIIIIYIVDRLTHFNMMIGMIHQQKVMKDQMKHIKKNLKNSVKNSVKRSQK
jgi:hypothetical protein